MSDAKKYDFGDELEDLASSDDWTPHKEANDTSPDKPDMEQVRQIAEGQGWESREPSKAPAKKPQEDGSFTVRAKQSVIDEFKDFAKQQEPKWPHGYVFERALAALKRELEEQSG